MDAKKCDACGTLYGMYNGQRLFPESNENEDNRRGMSK